MTAGVGNNLRTNGVDGGTGVGWTVVGLVDGASVGGDFRTGGPGGE